MAGKLTPNEQAVQLLPATVIWAAMAKTQEFKLAFSLSEGDLVDVDLGFGDQKTSQGFEEGARETLNDFRAMMKQTVSRFETNFGSQSELEFDPMEQVNSRIAMLESVQISADGKTVNITVPRPADLEKQVEDHIASMAAIRRSLADFEGSVNAAPFEEISEPPKFNDSTRKPVDTKPVIVVARSISAGQEFTAANLKKELWR